MEIEETAGTPNKFIVVREEVLDDKNLTMAEKFVYVRICQFDEYFEGCKEAGNVLGLSTETVKKAKQKLVRLGYITELSNTGRGKRYKAKYDLDASQTGKIYPSEGYNLPVRRVKSTRRVLELKKKENIDTKVSIGESELSPVDAESQKKYGREDINRMFDEWEDAFSYRPKDTKANRYAVSNLLRNKQIGYQKLSGIIKALPKLQERRFCIGKVKGVSDFVSLQREWDAVWAMALREYNKQQNKFNLEDLRV